MTTPTAPPPATTHEHGWVTLSAHVTSDGTVRYVRCAVCHAVRVDEETTTVPPVPITSAFPPPGRHRSATMQA